MARRVEDEYRRKIEELEERAERLRGGWWTPSEEDRAEAARLSGLGDELQRLLDGMSTDERHRVWDGVPLGRGGI